MDGFFFFFWENQTNDIISTYKKFLNLFCIFFKQELEQDISNVDTKFQRVLFVRCEEFRTESQVLLLSKSSSLCKPLIVY